MAKELDDDGAAFERRMNVGCGRRAEKEDRRQTVQLVMSHTMTMG